AAGRLGPHHGAKARGPGSVAAVVVHPTVVVAHPVSAGEALAALTADVRSRHPARVEVPDGTVVHRPAVERSPVDRGVVVVVGAPVPDRSIHAAVDAATVDRAGTRLVVVPIFVLVVTTPVVGA